MKIYFAGSDRSPKYDAILLSVGAKNRLESYYSLREVPNVDTAFKSYLLDSGGFAARTRGVAIDVRKYAEFINKYNIKLAFNLDTNNLKETLENQKYLNAYTKAYIIPIYHMSDWVDNNNLLNKFIDEGFDYIGLGGTAGVANANSLRTPFFNHCFSIARDKIKLHGLGVTSQTMLYKYPFYSVDSTSWLSAARYGNSIDKGDKRVTLFRARTKHYLDNTRREAASWVQIEKDVTRLWETKGIKWQ